MLWSCLIVVVVVVFYLWFVVCCVLRGLDILRRRAPRKVMFPDIFFLVSVLRREQYKSKVLPFFQSIFQRLLLISHLICEFVDL